MADFEREIRMLPAYDKRAEGYGLHGVDMLTPLEVYVGEEAACAG